eukprot:TRINITY_DN9682_c0_g2_i1.p1 TRINITY_DN9682_c0_g2~~TRINITY_DN9682_c0_g2_i1.p1  ORF type:complete len:756 (+),score=170.88 TRINITY_DN9682_c0_g2_i1:110-2269(+)
MPAAALDSYSIYEQVAKAKHAHGFFDDNPLPPPPRPACQEPRLSGDPSPGVYLSRLFGDNAVLQREPARSALYGRIYPAAAGARVSVRFDPAVAGQSAFTASTDESGAWRVLLPAAPAGGAYSATAWCDDCGAAAKANATMVNATFGDVWFCSGQSNMQLGMIHTVERNVTKRAITAGRYSNMRFFTWPQNNVWDGQVDYADVVHGGPWHLPAERRPGSDPDYWYLDDFSAHCWYTFQELTDILAGKGETVPFGLIESAWGGTEVQSWTPNATLDARCTSLVGGKPAQATYPPGSGALYNGMVLPLVNMTIKGATWFQGENNCGECDVRCKDKRQCRDSNATTCGSILKSEGYPCYLETMIKSWRQAWSAVPGTTDPNFPFGIQILTSVEGSCGGGAFRSAQALNEAVLPNSRHPHVFLSQGYDAQEPIGINNWPVGVRGSRFQGIDSPYSMESSAPAFLTPESGAWDGTNFLMGPIHPRVKRIVGRRLALAAAETVYARGDLITVGPTLKNCSVLGNGLQIWFDDVKLKDDAVHVLPSMLANFDLPSDLQQDLCSALPQGSQSPFCSTFGGLSPLEVRYTVPVNSSANVSVWMPASLHPTSTDHIHTGCKTKCNSSGLPRGCCTNYTRTEGWNYVTTHTNVPKNLNLPVPDTRLSDYITGVRYAWSAAPCCPGIDRNQYPCAPNSCPIRGYNSTLPANPFYAEIVNGRCRCTAPQTCS